MLLAARGTKNTYNTLCNESSLGIRTVIWDFLYTTNKRTKYISNTIVAFAAAKNEPKVAYEIHKKIHAVCEDKNEISKSMLCIKASDIVPKI